MAEKLETAIGALRFARRIIGAETENEEAAGKLDDVIASLA